MNARLLIPLLALLAAPAAGLAEEPPPARTLEVMRSWPLDEADLPGPPPAEPLPWSLGEDPPALAPGRYADTLAQREVRRLRLAGAGGAIRLRIDAARVPTLAQLPDPTYEGTRGYPGAVEVHPRLRRSPPAGRIGSVWVPLTPPEEEPTGAPLYLEARLYAEGAEAEAAVGGVVLSKDGRPAPLAIEVPARDGVTYFLVIRVNAYAQPPVPTADFADGQSQAAVEVRYERR